MNRILYYLLTILVIISFAACSLHVTSHKHQMIDAINRGDYASALSHISQVDNWEVDVEVDLNHGIPFLLYADSLNVDSAIVDSATIYVCSQLEEVATTEHINGNYEVALQHYDLLLSLYTRFVGNENIYVAKTLSNVGGVLYEMADYENAEIILLESVNFWETFPNITSIDYFDALIYLASIYAEQDKFNLAENCYKKALYIADKTNISKDDYIFLLGSIGILYYEMEDFENAKRFLCDSVIPKMDYHSILYNTKYPAYVKIIGSIYERRCDYKLAEQYYLEALGFYNYSVNTLYDNFEYQDILLHLGIIFFQQRQFDLSIKYYTDLLNILEKQPIIKEHQLSNYQLVLSSLGTLYHTLYDNESAEKYFIKALAIQKEFNKQDYAAISTLIHSGYFYEDIGDFVKSEKYFLEAYEIVINSSQIDTVLLASTLEGLGLHYLQFGESIEAEQYITKSYDLFMQKIDTTHIDYAITLGNIGLYYAQKKEYDIAIEKYKKCINFFKRHIKGGGTECALALNNLAILYLSKNDYNMAEICELDAISIVEQCRSKPHANIAMFYTNLGLILNIQKKYEQAYIYVLPAFELYKNAYISTLNYMNEAQRKKYWNTFEGFFNYFCLQFVYRYHFTKPSISTFAYNNELFRKGLLLSSSDAIRRSVLESGDNTLIAQYNELTSIKQMVMTIEEKDPQSPSLKQLRHQADSLEKIITASSAAYRENQAMWQIIWDSVQNHLSSNDVAIEYFSAPLSEDSTMYCALLLRHDSEYPELIPLFEEKEVSSFLSSSEGNITNQTYDYYANGDTISKLVWSKILPKINEGETIYFAPSGLLHQLAIEYLPYDENRTMSDVYNMVRLSSTREIVLNKQNTEYTTATLYGGIAYDLEEDVLLAESENYAKENLLASRSIENDTLNRGNVKYLPGTKKEAESINTLLKQNNISAKLYTIAQANEESFKALSGKHSNILHIGTHGFTWTDSVAKKQDYFTQRMQLQTLDGSNRFTTPTIDPLNRCGLLFAGANIALQGNSKNLPEGVQDGILTAKEISLLDLRDANLVVLSACETAKGDITSEGVFGLQRAFKMAGVQTIIMSLWKVNDQATQLLMTEFYNNWIGKHQSKRDAFRNAQNTVRTKYEEPEYWAGFIMLD